MLTSRSVTSVGGPGAVSRVLLSSKTHCVSTVSVLVHTSIRLLLSCPESLPAQHNFPGDCEEKHLRPSLPWWCHTRAERQTWTKYYHTGTLSPAVTTPPFSWLS
jgi:hypothetical protein